MSIDTYVEEFVKSQFKRDYECYNIINQRLTEASSIFDNQSCILMAAIILSAIHAYSDLQLRTIHGVEEKEKEDRKNRCINRTIGIFIEYFDSGKSEPIIDQKRWDKWHKESCKQFCNDFIKDSQNKDILKQQFGKAQKMINMTFKYLYCFDALRKPENGEYFKFCHMPLDSYTLKGWFENEVLNWYNKQSEQKNGKIYKKDIPNWSTMNKYETENELGSYLWIQCKIRDYLKNDDNKKYCDKKGKLTPFKAEFYIWEEEKAKDKTALIEFKNAVNKIGDGDADFKISDYCKNNIMLLLDKEINQ